MPARFSRLRRILQACGVGIVLAIAAIEGIAMSPILFFREVERVGLLCAVDAEPVAESAAPDAARLCSSAAAELVDQLGSHAPAVLILAVNDERLADPALLTILLHAQTRAAPEVGGTLTAFAVTLHRQRSDVGVPPFFLAPPEAIATRASATPDDAAVRSALRRLLHAAVARPLRAAR